MAVSSLLSPELRSVDFYVRNQILALEEDIIHEFKVRHSIFYIVEYICTIDELNEYNLTFQS